MKIKQILFVANAILFMAACSNKENIESGQANTVEIGNITITEESFISETPAKTRAVQAPQIVDLGDGLIAEVSITEDTSPAATRAAIPDGHYTIYATKPVSGSTPGTSAPILARLSGTVQGGKFVRDAGSRMRLAPDTYTFVYINDAISKSTHSYHGDVFVLTNDKANPMMGVTTMAITGGTTEVIFEMKHRETARVRFQITSYTADGHNVTGDVSFTSTMITTYFDMEGRMFGGIPCSHTSGTYTFAEDAVTPSPYKQAVKRTTNYRYFTSGVNGSAAQFTLQGGTLYGKSLAGKSFPLTSITQLQENKSYTCNITFKPSVLYLFEDGSVGVLSDKGSRTPIGIVLEEKTPTEKGLAMALTNASNTPQVQTPGYYFGWITDNGGFDNLHGYDLTYTTNYLNSYATPPSLPPGEDTRCQAYYAAAHYSPILSVTGSNIGKWFLPSTGHWKLSTIKLGSLNPSTLPTTFMEGGMAGGGTPAPQVA